MKNFARWLFMKYWKEEISILITMSTAEEAPEACRAGIRSSLDNLCLKNYEVENNAN